MKLLAHIVAPALALLGAGGWWLSRDESSEPSVFENAPIVLEESAPPKTSEESEELVSEPAPAPTTLAAPLSAPAPPTPAPAPSPVPFPTPAPAGSGEELSITDRLITFGYRTPPSPRTIDAIVLHSTYNASGGDPYNLDKILAQFEQYGVGAHYLIDRSGKVYRLVRESDIAYHAGASKMPDGRKNVNDFSIGIELMGTEESGFSDKQYAAVNAIIAEVETRHEIRDVVGHGDVAPARKTDPWKFDWKKLK